MAEDCHLLERSVCMVTGASRGVGRATALRLAAAGATVIGSFKASAAEAADLEAQAASSGHIIRTVRCDVRDRHQVQATIAEVLDAFGRIDALVNNAGIWRGGRIAELPEHDWREVLETNLFGVFHMTQAVLPSMLAARRGRIVNVSSVVALAGYPGDCAYSSAKAAVIAFTRSLAKETAALGIVASAVTPGTLDTDMTMSLSERAREQLLARVPAGRRGRPEEVAEVVEFLLTGPSYLTGSVVSIDGALS